MRKILTFIFVAILPLVANAYDAYIDGIYYNFSGDEATVTYREEWSISYSGTVVIPESVTYSDNTYNVTSIGSYAFHNCNSLTSITIPGSVTSIGDAAFTGCSGLSSITIPNSVTSIGDWAFQYCSGLRSATISEGVTSIGNSAFSECNYLSSITIPNSVTTIGDEAFFCCGSMESLTLGNGLTSIGRSAFSECSGLTSVTIPSSMTSINSGVFAGCSSLTSVTIPESVTSIGSDAFNECFSLTSITIPNSVTSIGSCAFLDCYFASSSFVNNSSLTSDNNWGAVICDEETADGLLIKDYTVVKCRTWATSVTIPESVNSIGYRAFYECNVLRSVTISEGVTSIGDEAFRYCYGLTSVTIPNSLNSIGNGAFYNCNGLNSVTIPEGVTHISDFAFYACHGLNSVSIPNSVTSIGAKAFTYTPWYDNQPDGLVYAGKVAYEYKGTMPEETHITIEDGTLGIAGSAFYHCYGLTSVTIPSSVTSIGSKAFYGCNLTNVKVDVDTPIAISSEVFSNQFKTTLVVPFGSKAAYEAADYWNEFKEIVEIPTVTIGSIGYATYCSEFDLDFSEVSGLKAYIASGFSPSTGKLVLTRVTEVPAGEGLYLVGDAGTYEIPFTETDMVYSNLLKGVTTATTIYPTDGDYTNFILANGSHGVAFYSLSAAGELAAGKAYLQLPTTSASDVKAISVIFDDNEDAVLNIEEDSQTQRIYNLQGQQVNALKSGLYIINGKKVFIK